MRFWLWGCEFVIDLRDLGGFGMWGFVNFDERFDFVFFFWLGDVGMFVCVCVFDV